jgi:hypothetical protein
MARTPFDEVLGDLLADRPSRPDAPMTAIERGLNGFEFVHVSPAIADGPKGLG